MARVILQARGGAVRQPSSISVRLLGGASNVALVFAVLFFVASAGASIDGPDAVRGMATLFVVCLVMTIGLKLAATFLVRRQRRDARDERADG
jgi:hypothetical protein